MALVARQLRDKIRRPVILEADNTMRVMLEFWGRVWDAGQGGEDLADLLLINISSRPPKLLHILLNMQNIPVQARYCAKKQEVEGHHDVAEEEYAAHGLRHENCRFLAFTIIFVWEVQLVAVDEPDYEEWIHEKNAHELVPAPEIVEVPNYVYFEENCEAAECK